MFKGLVTTGVFIFMVVIMAGCAPSASEVASTAWFKDYKTFDTQIKEIDISKLKDNDKEKLLKYAAMSKYDSCRKIDYLLSKGSFSKELINKAYIGSIRYAKPDTIDCLVKHGVNVNYSSRYGNENAIHRLLNDWKSNEIHMKMLEKLIAVGVDYKQQNKKNITPTQLAKNLSNEKAYKYLLSKSDPKLLAQIKKKEAEKIVKEKKEEELRQKKERENKALAKSFGFDSYGAYIQDKKKQIEIKKANFLRNKQNYTGQKNLENPNIPAKTLNQATIMEAVSYCKNNGKKLLNKQEAKKLASEIRKITNKYNDVALVPYEENGEYGFEIGVHQTSQYAKISPSSINKLFYDSRNLQRIKKDFVTHGGCKNLDLIDIVRDNDITTKNECELNSGEWVNFKGENKCRIGGKLINTALKKDSGWNIHQSGVFKHDDISSRFLLRGKTMEDSEISRRSFDKLPGVLSDKAGLILKQKNVKKNRDRYIDSSNSIIDFNGYTGKILYVDVDNKAKYHSKVIEEIVVQVTNIANLDLSALEKIAREYHYIGYGQKEAPPKGELKVSKKIFKDGFEVTSTYTWKNASKKYVARYFNKDAKENKNSILVTMK